MRLATGSTEYPDFSAGGSPDAVPFPAIAAKSRQTFRGRLAYQNCPLTREYWARSLFLTCKTAGFSPTATMGRIPVRMTPATQTLPVARDGRCLGATCGPMATWSGQKCRRHESACRRKATGQSGCLTRSLAGDCFVILVPGRGNRHRRMLSVFGRNAGTRRPMKGVLEVLAFARSLGLARKPPPRHGMRRSFGPQT